MKLFPNEILFLVFHTKYQITHLAINENINKQLFFSSNNIMVKEKMVRKTYKTDGIRGNIYWTVLLMVNRYPESILVELYNVKVSRRYRESAH